MQDQDRTAVTGSAGGFRPPRWARLALVMFAALAIVVAAAGFSFGNVYAPLQVVGGGPDATPGSLFVRSDNGTGPDDATTLVYCSKPGGRFAILVTLTNTGLFPVTLLGASPTPDIPNPDPTVFRLLDFAAYRPVASDPMSSPSDPQASAPLTPTNLDPGQTLDVWARYQMGTEVLQEPGVLSIPYLNVRYSTFGMPRTSEIPLPAAPGITGDCHR